MNIKIFPFLLLLLSFSEGSKLNLPRVLLPIFKTFSTNYTLEVTGFGCYKWSSSRVDVVVVTPIEENQSKGCSQKAIVSSVGRVSTRTMAIVLAEEVVTGQVFRADVIVDVIHSLNVITTTRELYMEEPPEMFEVRAYDSEGNEFTTLEGVEVEWNLIRERSGQEVIRFISFRESTYETPNSIALFDSIGKQGHIVLLEGIRTGTSKVSVRLPHAEYSNVKSVEVTISVIANLIIDPSDVYIMQGDQIHFRILQVRQGRLIEIKKTSNPQYILTPEDNTIVQMENQIGRGLNLGRCKLHLRDLNSNNVGYEQQKLPQAFVTVVVPSYISLSIYPFNNWAMFTDQSATLVTEVFDSDNHKITLGDRSHIVMKLDETIFPISWKSSNGSYANGKTITPGVTEVRSHLYEAGVGSGSVSPLLKTSATLHVFPPLSLHPSVVAFPYHHINWNEIEMRVEGGDGINLWATHNHSVAVVNQGGVLKPKGEGETKVEVSMVRNENLKATSSVLVLKPHAIEILGGIHETPVGSHIYLDVALYGLTKHGVPVPFTDCSEVKFIVEIDSGFQQDRSVKREPHKEACAVISLLAKQDSKSRVVVSLDNDIKAETLVAAFNPLGSLHPTLGRSVVLSLKSSRDIVFTGGPKPWFGKVVSSYTQSSNILQASLNYESQEIYVYNIVCNKLGSTEFTLTTYTEPYISSIQPVKSQSKITVICAKPKHLDLSAYMGPDCPLSDLDRALAVKNSKVKIKITVRDSEGRKFDNATSLLYKWTWGNKDNLFAVEDPERINLSKEDHSEYVLPLDHYKELITKNTVDSATIKLKAIAYLHDRASEIQAEGSLMMNIIDNLVSEPSSLTVVNKVGAQSMVTLHYGSGYFNVDSNPDNICEFEFDSSLKRVLWIKPLLDGKTNLKITDKCLSSSVNLPVEVLNVGYIRIEVTSRMEVNRHVTALVKLYDTLDRELTGDVDDINLESTTSGIISIARSDPKNPRVFLIKGLEVGRSSLIASFNGISSPPAQIQVFTAIKLFPRNITLIVGSVYQVRVTGGPGPDLQFSISDDSIASISNTGLITALHIGESWVSVSTLGGEGKDSIGVTVVPLTGVQISGPTGILCLGGVAPLWAQPLPETISPLVLGAVNPPFTYSWSSSLPGVAHVTDRYSNVNINVREEDRLSIAVHGAKPGRTVIYLRLTGGTVQHGHHDSSFELVVVDRLEFTSPPTSLPGLIVAPNTIFSVRTNIEEANLDIVPLGTERVLTLNSDNTVSSHDSGKAIVSATTIGSNQQTASLFIQVKPVHYMMVNIANVLNGTSLSGLPRGLELLVNITYHDTLGRTFYAAPSKLSLAFNRHDKLLVKQGCTNSSYVFGLEGKGITILGISDSISPLSQDYLKVPVHNHIVPARRQMTVGEIVCFDSIIDKDGVWSSKGDAVVIEQHSGLVRAVRPGHALVTYRQSQPLANIQTSLDIDVHPLYSLSLVGGLSLSNAEIGREYIIGVELLNQRDARLKQTGGFVHMSTPCKSSQTVAVFPYRCEIRFNSLSVPYPISTIFSVAPTFHKQTGSYGCSVKVISGISPNTSVIMSNVTLRINISPDFHSEQSVETHISTQSTSLVLEFHPAVYVATQQLNLNTPSSSVYLVIVGTQHVAQHIIVEASDRTVLKVGEAERRGAVSWTWSVELYREHWNNYNRLSPQYLIVLSSLTNQTIKVPVVFGGGNGNKGCVYNDGQPWVMSDLVPSATTSIFVALMAIIVFFMASNYCYNSMRGESSPRPRHSPSHPTHASLQEYSLGSSKSPSSPLGHRSIVYGSSPYQSSSPEQTPLNKSSPRLRRLYQ